MLESESVLELHNTNKDTYEAGSDTASVLEMLPIGVCVITEDLVVRQWNHKLEEWTGLSKPEAIGSCLSRHFPNLLEPQYSNRLKQVFSTGMPAKYSAAKTKRVAGLEALVRWFHPVRGTIPPDIFIGIAESTASIIPIGEWILERACRDACQWPNDIMLSVNVSAVQLQSGGFCSSIEEALCHSGLPPSRLEIEVTETAFLGNSKEVLRTLNLIRDIGVRIAMDDFGTGYSSLSYLRDFHFDKIKLDQSFVRNNNQPESKAIISAVAGIGESLGLETCAEGVETHEQFEIVRLEGYSHVQGYLFGKPASQQVTLGYFNSEESSFSASSDGAKD